MKKFLLVLFMLAMLTIPVFAANTNGQSDAGTIAGVDLTYVSRLLTLIVGVFGGIYILIKTAIDIVSAVAHQDSDPQAIRKALVRFLVGAVIIGGFFGLRNFIIKGDSNSQNNASASAADVFSQVISIEGSEVDMQYLRDFEIPSDVDIN